MSEWVSGQRIQLAHPILCFRDNKKSDMGPETTICVVGPSFWSANLLMWFRYLVVPFVVSLVWNVAICWFGHTHRINILDGGPILLTTICDIAQGVHSWIYKNQQSLLFFNTFTKLVDTIRSNKAGRHHVNLKLTKLCLSIWDIWMDWRQEFDSFCLLKDPSAKSYNIYIYVTANMDNQLGIDIS